MLKKINEITNQIGYEIDDKQVKSYVKKAIQLAKEQERLKIINIIQKRIEKLEEMDNGVKLEYSHIPYVVSCELGKIISNIRNIEKNNNKRG